MRIRDAGRAETQFIDTHTGENTMARINTITRYVETTFVATLSLVALAGIIRLIVLAV
jgi:hypothetical protein